MNKGSELWRKAKTLIPSGNQLLSKRSERFLPEGWPAYYVKAEGCRVWDLEGTEYKDFAQMGVGSCILGYANAEVNEFVINAISQGSMASLNSYEEVELAEKLITLHPWAEMARFARTGGEACSVAVRIARAAAGKTKVAFCGYHGWHDWYVSANIGNESNLDDQLLPGIAPNGVPRELQGTAIPFYYNDLGSLEQVVKKHPDIGVIIMEPLRNYKPSPEFLAGVRKVATDMGAVLVFDEITSGFRINNGGIHLNHRIEPDMAVFGKALGNGFPISAIIGKRSVMEAAQSSFISSTFWTERIGYVAALKTLEIIDRENVPAHLIHYGDSIVNGWKDIAEKNDLDITVSGISPLAHIHFNHTDASQIQTYYAQEMLRRGYLLGASVYSTFAYTDEIIDEFLENSDAVFKQISQILEDDTIQNYLDGPVIESGFGRLN